MKTEISKAPSTEWKHWLGVFLQMGRVQLDSDWNEQTDLTLRMQQRSNNDAISTGSPNEGFRVDNRVLIDAADDRSIWTAGKQNPGDPDPHLYVDYVDFRTGRGALSLEGGVALVRSLPQPIDCRGWREIVVAAKGSFNPNEIDFFLEEGGTRGVLNLAADAATVDGWTIFRADPATAAPAVNLSQIGAFGLANLNPARQYQIDYIKADIPIRRTLIRIAGVSAFSATAPAGQTARLSVNDDDRFGGTLVLQAESATSVTAALPVDEDLTSIRRITLAIRTVSGAAPAFNLAAFDGAASHTLAAAATITAGDWTLASYDVPQGAIDWSHIRSFTFSGLTATEVYRISEAMAEMAANGNLVIHGGDGSSEGAGRFYGDGLAAVLESHQTYLSQRDLPAADPAALAPPANDRARIDLAYLDLWERPITFIEDPDIREIALEGPDTCTRVQLIAQVRLLKGDEVANPTPPVAPSAAFAALLPSGNGTLTTKDTPPAALDPCADPCEPTIAGPFTGQENRLFRVEIHKFGQIGAANAASTARFKWSRENGAAASPLIEDAGAGSFLVKVEKPELFREGDLIEISNDLAELTTGPYEDRAQHRNHERGELRRITAIDLGARTLSWNDPGSPEPDLHAPLARSQDTYRHAHVRRWDGAGPVTAGDIVLDEGVVIEFGGGDFLPGDYWIFTTRVVDGSVERLIEARPHGIRRRYYPLASIRRVTDNTGAETVSFTDLRPYFDPLAELDASSVHYDPGLMGNLDPAWNSITNVQQAIDALSRRELGLDLRDHNKHLHGSGVVCGLQIHCNQDRLQVTIERGYALDCEGNVLRVRRAITYPVVAEADAIGALAGGSGEVLVSIRRGVGADVEVEVEALPSKTWWQTVLEGTLLLDFFNRCFKPIVDLLRNQFLPIPATAVPVPDTHRRLVSLINLFFQFLMPATGRYVFLSPREHEFIEKFYWDLRALLQSKTFCAMFDGVTEPPKYPYAIPAGIDTMFGLFGFHTRLRLHPNGRLAYSCGKGNRIFVYDLDRREMIASLLFPGGTNAEVKDVVVSPDGRFLHGVALLGDDSVFASATIDAAFNHVWGPTTVVCGFEFVTLGMTPQRPATLYSLARSRGLYLFNPAAIPLTPGAPNVTFNATGQMLINPVNDIAVCAQNTGVAVGTITPTFDRLARINLAAANAINAQWTIGGTDAQEDVLIRDAQLFATGVAGGARSVCRFAMGGGAPNAAVPLNVSGPVRLALSGRWLLVAFTNEHRLRRIDLSQGALGFDNARRVPVQFFPVALASNSARGEVYALNLLTTVSVVTASTVLDAGALPAFTAEPPATLEAYRNQFIQAFADLLSKFWQYVKDCFCEMFLVNCPDCGRDDKVYLGAVEIKGRRVYKICNFTKRKYVKSVQLVEYWLSTVPILPAIKKAFSDFCCRVF